MVLVSLYEVIVKFLSRKKLGLSLGVLIFSIVIIGPLLFPGYLLTLDMTFVPVLRIPRIVAGGFWNAALYRFPMHWLSLLMPGWIIQKGMLIALFTALPVIAYRFLLPRSTSVSSRVLAAFFYAFNPFVYTRFLAGQWTILFAYALLPFVWHAALVPENDPRVWWRRGILLGLCTALVFAFSLHLGIMALFLGMISSLSTVSRIRLRVLGRNTLVSLGTLFIATLYWTIPAALRHGPSVVSSFDGRHLEAFQTASDPLIGTMGNVLALYGFWGEHESWAQQFLWPKQNGWLWLALGGILAVLILLGIYQVIRSKESRRQGIALLVVGVLALVFSCGVGDTIFKPINTWLFTHISFWDGFRDSQKWSALLVLVYAFFIGSVSFANTNVKKIVTFLGVAAITIYTFPMSFGFWGQLKPIWYPPEWHQVNEILKQDASCKAIFLPWHGYYSLRFNNDLLTANLARDFFDCEIIQSRQVELGEIATQGPIDPAYDAVEGLVTGKDNLSVDQALSLLRAKNIRYVIFTPDLVGEDSVTYAFLTALRAEKMGDTGVVLYHLP